MNKITNLNSIFVELTCGIGRDPIRLSICKGSFPITIYNILIITYLKIADYTITVFMIRYI